MLILLTYLIALTALVIALTVAKARAAPWGIILVYWILVTIYWIWRALT